MSIALTTGIKTAMQKIVDAQAMLMEASEVIEKVKRLYDTDLSQQIITHVANAFSLKRAQLFNPPSREYQYTLPRHIAMWLMMNYTKNGVVTISKFFDVDHSTVSTAVKTLNERIQVEKELKAKIEWIEKNLFTDDK